MSTGASHRREKAFFAIPSIPLTAPHGAPRNRLGSPYAVFARSLHSFRTFSSATNAHPASTTPYSATVDVLGLAFLTYRWRPMHPRSLKRKGLRSVSTFCSRAADPQSPRHNALLQVSPVPSIHAIVRDRGAASCGRRFPGYAAIATGVSENSAAMMIEWGGGRGRGCTSISLPPLCWCIFSHIPGILPGGAPRPRGVARPLLGHIRYLSAL